MPLPRMIFSGLVAVVVLVAVAGAGWWFFIREDAELADSAPEIPDDLRQPTTTTGATPAPTTAGLAPVADGGFQILADRSTASYFAEEKLVSLSLPSTAQGTTSDIEGVLYLTDDGLDPDNESVFTVQLATVESDDGRRDNRVRGALEVTQFPEATFTATSLEGPLADLNPNTDTELTLTGILDLHGVEKEVTWDVLARRDGDVITATATVNFLYADFDIPLLNIANFVTVEEDVTLQVQLVAQAS